MNTSIICFDMDGTIANLYGVDNWLDYLKAENPFPYEAAEPLIDMKKLNEVCALLQKAGNEIRIITCMSKNASPEYKKAIREAKKAWLEKWGFIYDKFHCVDYKTAKREVIRKAMKTDKNKGAEAILIDDEARHTDHWSWGRTIDPASEDIIEDLWSLLPEDILN